MCTNILVSFSFLLSLKNIIITTTNLRPQTNSSYICLLKIYLHNLISLCYAIQKILLIFWPKNWL